MGRTLLTLAFLLLVGGLVVVTATGALEPGVLIFCGGVVFMGFYSLASSRDKAVSWVLIFVGMTILGEIVRLFSGT